MVGNTVFAVGPKGLEIVGHLGRLETEKTFVALLVHAGRGPSECVGQLRVYRQRVFGLAIVDISDLSKPRVAGYELDGVRERHRGQERPCLRLDGVPGVHLVDISDAENPQWIDTIHPKDVVTGIKAYRGLLVVNGMVKGLFDLTMLPISKTSPSSRR